MMQRHLNDPVCQHMRTDFARLYADQTVGEGLTAIRESQPEGRIIYFYVVDRDDRLQGVVPTRRLLLNPLDRPIAEIMVREVVAVPQTATVLDACEFFILHRLLAFPVVDEQSRIVGVVDVELYTDELSDLDRSAQNDDLFQLIGVHLSESQQATPLSAFRSRFPWLITNIAGGIVAAFLLGMFEVELQQVVALALFIPVVLALSESVSIQSVSLAAPGTPRPAAHPAAGAGQGPLGSVDRAAVGRRQCLGRRRRGVGCGSGCPRWRWCYWAALPGA